MKLSIRLLLIVVALGLCIPLSMAKAPVPVVDQPHMQAALDHLKAAKAELEQAEADTGGHRVAAIKATNDAIHHTQEGIEYARAH